MNLFPPDSSEWPEANLRDEGQNEHATWSQGNLLSCPTCGAVVTRQLQDKHAHWHIMNGLGLG